MAKTLSGIVTSVGMQQTVTVEVFRKVPHPLYRKLLKRSKKYAVALDGKDVQVGDTVTIVETKPVSKNKYFKIQEVTHKISEENK